MTPIKIMLTFFIAGVIFIPTGTSIYKISNGVSFKHVFSVDSELFSLKMTISILNQLLQIFEQRVVYDGSNPEDVQCQIDRANEGRKCKVSTVP